MRTGNVIQLITGDLIQLALQGQFDIIAHGCNCFHTMGAGIAKQIATKWPIVLQFDRTMTQRGDYDKMGTNIIVPVMMHSIVTENKGFVLDIVNMYTQYRYDQPSPGCKIPFDEYAFIMCLRKLAVRAECKDLYPHVARVGLPLIGAGLAGGSEQRTIQLIQQELDFRDMHVSIVKLPK
jgi:O-acetyl-ADP-ribose deacetylase (regulator of RNase III)